ncbi:MAG: sigma-70 family RNA polymerase sigma factor [Verrucomicrobia bacterium]|nr:sigma-70 family RNA polymerase sigma factor [Verrucomicrobiota bacterium]
MTNAAERSLALPETAVAALVAEHAAFRRFLVARLGNAADADDILQQALLRAMTHGGSLRRDERVVAWFYRVLRNALTDHLRKKQADARRAGRVLDDLRANEAGVVTPSHDWETAVCACFGGLLPSLKPRYAELIRRVDLGGEARAEVARDLKLSRAQFDVTLHRARGALRRRLEVFCGACSRESCLACACGTAPKKNREKV